MPLPAADWTRLSTLLDALLDTAPDARAARLRDEPDAEMRAAAARLLAAIDTDDDFLDADGGALASVGALVRPPADDAVPEFVGPYRIVREIGRGGMGVVYLAERADGAFEQQVAVKLLATADAGRAERLARERHILARLDHPGIARLRDGGQTPAGQPYLVLDHIDGAPLLDVARGLDLAARVRIVAQICEAVAYAHRRLVVHRDIKPSNVLVTPAGRAVLLDFGIAKLLDGDDDALTRDASPFTPAYAAPEQRSGGVVTTAADVYALGVVLRELLTGTRPSPSDARPAEIADRDLRAIADRAAHADPECRYASTDALSDDLTRYLGGHPVQARAVRPAYRARLFLRRHRAASLLTGVLLAALTGATGAALVQGSRATRALSAADTSRERAELTADVLFQLLGATDPGVARGDTLTAWAVLDRSLRQPGALARYPDLHARLLTLAGTVLRKTGQGARADTLLRGVLDLRALHEGASRLDRGVYMDLDADRRLDSLGLSAETELAELARDRSNYADAEVRYRAVLARSAARYGAASLAASYPMAQLGGVLADRNQPVEAESLLTRALALRRRHVPSGDPRLVTVLSTLGSLLFDRRRYADAEPLLREAVGIAGREGSTSDERLVSPLNNLGLLLADTRRLPEAIAVHRRSVALRERLYGRRHRLTATGLLSLGAALSSANSPDALPTLQASMHSARASVGEMHLLTAAIHNSIGFHLRSARRYDEAAAEYRAALHAFETVVGRDHPRSVTALSNLARVYVARERFDEALPLLEEAVRRSDRIYDAPHPNHAGVLNALGTALYRLDRKPDALGPYTRAARIYEHVYGNGDSRAQTARYTVALTHLETGDAERAVVLLNAETPPASGANEWLSPLWARSLGDALARTERTDEALMAFERAFYGFDAAGPSQRGNARGVALQLADLYTRLSRPIDAIVWQARAQSGDQ